MQNASLNSVSSIDGDYNTMSLNSETIKMNGEVILSSIALESLKKQLGYSDVLVKCTYCGHWAAVQTSCRHCGAPVG